MLFLLNLSLAIQLIALGLGVVLLVWGFRHEGAGIVVAKVFGFIITIATIFLLVCTIYHGMTHGKSYSNMNYGQTGTTQQPNMMQQKRQQMMMQRNMQPRMEP